MVRTGNITFSNDCMKHIAKMFANIKRIIVGDNRIASQTLNSLGVTKKFCKVTPPKIHSSTFNDLQLMGTMTNSRCVRSTNTPRSIVSMLKLPAWHGRGGRGSFISPHHPRLEMQDKGFMVRFSAGRNADDDGWHQECHW